MSAPGGGWAWDVGLVVTGMPPEARSAFRRELQRWRSIDTEDVHPGRRARLDELDESIALRTAMEDQALSIIRNARVTREVSDA